MTGTKKIQEMGFDIFKQNEGNVSNASIAKELNVKSGTVRKWKSRYKWKEKIGRVPERITKDVTESKYVTKDLRDEQKEKIIQALYAIKSYSPALDVLIEVYLDCFEEYEHAKSRNFETESLRKEMARLLGQLGLNINNKSLVSTINEKTKKEKEPVQQPVDNKLIQFRQRMKK